MPVRGRVAAVPRREPTPVTGITRAEAVIPNLAPGAARIPVIRPCAANSMAAAACAPVTTPVHRGQSPSRQPTTVQSRSMPVIRLLFPGPLPVRPNAINSNSIPPGGTVVTPPLCAKRCMAEPIASYPIATIPNTPSGSEGKTPPAAANLGPGLPFPPLTLLAPSPAASLWTPTLRLLSMARRVP